MNIADRITEFAVESRYDAMPAHVLEVAKLVMMDTIGVTLPGSREKSPRLSAQIAREEGAREEASVFGRGFKTSAINAAFANGTASHVMDFDHSFVGMGQPMASVTPAIFALGESIGASGRQIIEAYVVGFEASAQLLFATRRRTDTGWTSPGRLVGSYGTTAACARLLGLDATQTKAALGITVLTSNGVFHLGTMDKSLQVGLAAKDSLLAVKLAQSGFVSDAPGVEESLGCADGIPDSKPLDDLGHSYALITAGPRIKPYPCGGLAHGVIDGVLGLRAEYGLTPEMIDSLDVDMSRNTYGLAAFPLPTNGIEGKFSLAYILARGVIDGKVSLDAFTDDAVRNTTALELASKVHMTMDPELRATPNGSHPCRVSIRLSDGRTVERRVDHMRGTLEVPVTPDELRDKFRDCASNILGDTATDQALDYFRHLEAMDDTRPLCQILIAGA